MEDLARQEMITRYAAAAADERIMQARLHLIGSAGPCFDLTAKRLHVIGFFLKNDVALGTALLCHIASDLISSIHALCDSKRFYSVAALLRQLIEVEYLAFLGYIEPLRVAEWYRLPPEQIRRQFSPKQMRRASGGLFADHEYWVHCVTGGHPHPNGRILLAEYSPLLDPSAATVPDACHHISPLWNSIRLAQNAQERQDCVSHELADAYELAVREWRAIEDDLVLSHDGIRGSGLKKEG